MFGYGYNNGAANRAITNELVSDLWIQQNIPGGLNSKWKYLMNRRGKKMLNDV